MAKKNRLLVVEDDFLVALDMIDALEASGFEVIGPVPDLDASMQIAAAANVSIDGAVLDLNLHGTLSYPLADLLKQGNIPFIFTTGYDTSSIPDRFGDVPALEKPADGKAVATLMGELIGDIVGDRSSV